MSPRTGSLTTEKSLYGNAGRDLVEAGELVADEADTGQVLLRRDAFDPGVVSRHTILVGKHRARGEHRADRQESEAGELQARFDRRHGASDVGGATGDEADDAGIGHVHHEAPLSATSSPNSTRLSDSPEYDQRKRNVRLSLAMILLPT